MFQAVEKRLTEDNIRSGQLTVGPQEREHLGLPEHTTDVTVAFDGERHPVQWHGRARRLEGEWLIDILGLHCAVGEIVRLHRSDHGLVVERVGGASSALTRSRSSWQSAPISTERRSSSDTRPAVRRRKSQRRQERFRIRSRDDYRWEGRIGFHHETSRRAREELEKGGWDHESVVDLRLRGEELALLDSFEHLLAVDAIKLELFPWQEAAARTLLSRMRGRGVLADEVGLGKTIEAGTVITELILRGLAKRILVVCPSTLREQWKEELREKFDLEFVVIQHSHQLSDAGDRLIMTMQMASNNLDTLNDSDAPWDVLVVDEAHKIPNTENSVWRSALQELSNRYVAFLTATPVQNSLADLYSIVNFLKPGTFTSKRDFWDRYGSGDKRRPRRTAELRRLVSDVMIRTTRAQAGLDRVTRLPKDVPITLNEQEQRIYEMCTDLLRNVMQDSSDTMRRRILALRMVSSPRSLGKTALKMADSHPDPRASRVLEELGHLAADLGMTNREKKLLELARSWVDDHGRVLVFSQHTDTVERLLQLLDAADIPTEAFHGKMSASQKAESVASFRSGDAKVLVSSDAGAEGQNLQVCYCVINYDLPWNPMRIEQRIGRVHRLTQKSDVVHVANFFAKNTIDERVYALLHEKLAMFELLFGQVTTILGELDESRDAKTFEGRIIDALTSSDDHEMSRRLDDLGRQLSDARERSNQGLQAGADSANAWLVSGTTEDRFSHRRELTGTDATELQPEVKEHDERRQRSVTEFVRDYFLHFSGETLFEDDAFATFGIPDELREDFGGVERLHLAFGREGLETHPEAELCAAGSEVFDEILRSLRYRGDLIATGPQPPPLDPEPSIKHVDDVRMVDRQLRGPKGVWIEATWRTSTGEGRDEQIVTTSTGPPPEWSLPRSPLEEGEHLPDTLDSADEMIRSVEESARPTFQEISDELHSKQVEREAEHNENLRKHYRRRIKEVDEEISSSLPHSYKRDQLHEQRDQLEKTLNQLAITEVPEVELRAELLALKVELNEDFDVLETWENSAGETTQLKYPWRPRSRTSYKSSVSGNELSTLALCASAHLIDADERQLCASCRNHRCERCGADGEFEPCVVCQTPICGACRRSQAGRCSGCLDPVRLPEADTPDGLAYRLGGDQVLLVRQRSANLLSSDGGTLLLTDEDLHSKAARYVRHVADELEVSPDSELRLDGDLVLPSRDGNDLWFDVEVEIDARRDPIDEQVAEAPDDEYIPTVDERPNAAALERHALSDVVSRLRQAHPPPAPSSRVVLAVRATVRRLRLEGDKLTLVTEQVSRDADSERQVQRTTLEKEPVPSDLGTVVAQGQLDGSALELTRIHRGHLAVVTTPQGVIRIYLPGQPELPLDEERRWVQVLRSRGLDDPVVLDIDDAAATEIDARLVSPRAATLVSRDIEVEWNIEEGKGPRPVAGADSERVSADIEAVPLPDEVKGPNTPGSRAVHELVELLPKPTHVTAKATVLVTETWQGSGGQKRVEYQTSEPGPIRPRSPRGEPLDDFDVDSSGHLHAPQEGRTCNTCERPFCVHCIDDELVADCPDCERLACIACLSSAGDVEKLTCAICGIETCPGCGFGSGITACGRCLQPVCGACRAVSTCDSCDSLVRLTPEELQSLPDELVLDGCAVTSAVNGSRQIVFIQARNRREVAWITDGRTERWVDLQPEGAAIRRLGRQFAWSYGLSGNMAWDDDIDIVRDRPDAPEDALLISEARSWQIAWTLKGDGTSYANGSLEIPTPSDPKGETCRVIAADQEIDGLLTPEVGGYGVNFPTLKHVRYGVETRLSVEAHDSFDLVMLTGAGLERRVGDVRNLRRRTRSWQRTEDNVFGSKVAAPTCALHAADDGLSVTVAAWGEHLVAVVRDPQRSSDRIVLLRSHPDHVIGAVIAQMASVDGIGLPVQSMDPEAIVGPTLTNGEFVDRDLHLALHPTDEPQKDAFAADDDALMLATKYLGSDVVPTTTEQAGCTDEFLGTLDRRIRAQGGSTPFHPLGVGFEVEETWRAGGEDFTIRYRVLPSKPQAPFTTVDTRQEVDEAFIDRSGHVVQTPHYCPYCQTLTCLACDDPTRQCAICHAAVCGQCATVVAEQLLCPACGDLSQLSRREAKDIGLYQGLFSSVYRGQDDLHTVHVADHSGGYKIHTRFTTRDDRVYRPPPERTEHDRNIVGHVKAVLKASR